MKIYFEGELKTLIYRTSIVERMIEKPRGTRDLGPEEMSRRRKVEEELRTVSRSFGYHEIMTPTFEHTELFLKRSGPSIVEEIYDFEDKGGREIALRPEFTAPVMRMYSESMRERPKPLKVFYFGPAYRYERPQSGRYREFWHFGTELIGPDTPRADAENIALAISSLRKLGLKDFSVRISNLQILDIFLKEREIPEEKRGQLYHALDNEEDVKDILGPDTSDEFISFLNTPLSELEGYLQDTSPIEYLKKVLETLEFYEIKEEDYTIDLRIVRGLDYYQGVVFEIDAHGLGAEEQVCGGGDYNLGDLFGLDVSSKGFALGFDRVVLALEDEGKLPFPEKGQYYIIPIGEGSLGYSYDVLDMLREKGVSADIELMDRGVGNALSYADRADFRYSILIGEDEVKEGTVTIKEMESGEQKTLVKEDFLSEVEKSE